MDRMDHQHNQSESEVIRMLSKEQILAIAKCPDAPCSQCVMDLEDSFCNSERLLREVSKASVVLYEKVESQQAVLSKVLSLLQAQAKREDVEIEEGRFGTGCKCCGASEDDIAEYGHDNCDIGEAIAIIERALGGGDPR
jgi:hypothetical protein